MSRENFDKGIYDIVGSMSVINKSYSETARELGVSRQTIRRITEGQTQRVSQKSLDKIAEHFQDLPNWKKGKALYGAAVIQEKVSEKGNRKEAIKALKEDKKEFNKETKKQQELWKDLTRDQKIQRGYSPNY
jgi:predicted transcriptional regulator